MLCEHCCCKSQCYAQKNQWGHFGSNGICSHNLINVNRHLIGKSLVVTSKSHTELEGPVKIDFHFECLRLYPNTKDTCLMYLLIFVVVLDHIIDKHKINSKVLCPKKKRENQNNIVCVYV